MSRKGIILAGGSGTRLHPSTLAISKQLIPVFDKPMVYYPLTTLMLAGIREILIISTARDIPLFKELLGDGSSWGMSFEYAVQNSPDGLAQAITIGANFIDSNPSALILGDNIFYGDCLSDLLYEADSKKEGATIFAYRVSDPERYGIVEFDDKCNVISLEEKPKIPKSNFAVTGLYFYDKEAPYLVNQLKPSARGELEITDLNNLYREKNKLSTKILKRGYAWLDTGTHESLLEASQFIATIEHRQGLKIGCPEEIAWRMGWINEAKLEELGSKIVKSGYGQYLLNLLHER
ncbi:glucose-1-phosphate thymidylyltransferase RfbA [Rickettsia endosymbiont of Halotydeus destructor]|uniref:glucose-1-phosphate thymidylyltransferase RfbA n=1 Tax=Rickettsia endosymbiont of Halotydeus destructor TaxID=2996754 RepID=UPI003BAF667C